MVRTYKKKTNRGETPAEVFVAAADEVASGISLRRAALTANVDKMTLKRYIEKSSQLEPGQLPKIGYLKTRQVFTDYQESQLADYILHCSRIYYGLCPKEIRKLAYEYAIANKVKIGTTWTEQNMASADWFSAFMKRFPRLSIRTPEATSLGRATSFNKHNVKTFFDNLKTVLDRYKFDSSNIWNTDETGLQTVQRPGKIVAEKGKKQIGRTTSAERGTTVTMILAVNACGNSIPPMLIFPRVFYKERFVNNGPPNCIGAAHPSGWVTGDTFLIFIKHFVHHVRCSKENRCLLILDNHSSHLAIAVLDYCSENGVVLLSFPPHTTHRLQPLDVSVFGPFKKYFFHACDRWMTSNPGKTITIYDIPSILKEALPDAVVPRNILSGFRVTGIAPFNPEIFGENDFLSSAVTDRPFEEHNEDIAMQKDLLPNAEENNPDNEKSQDESNEEGLDNNRASTSGTVAKEPISCTIVRPSQVRPYPKAQPRTQSNRGKKRKSTILTDSPEKELLRGEEEARAMKNKLSNSKRNLCGKQNNKEDKSKGKKKKKLKTVESSDEDEEECFCLICMQSFAQSKQGDDWIQCTKCLKWAHVACGSGDAFYVCVNCESDNNDDSN